MKKIELKSKIINDKYTEYVYESFDIQNREETSVSISMNLGDYKTFDWNIGVILGGSGSGKTTILKKMGDVKKVNFDAEKPLISNFNWLQPKDAALVLTSMGLSSVPTWLRPFHTLSNGEQYRATLAYLVASAKDDEVILIDEYTSVVDRDVAKAMSFALQKYIRRENKRIILASCHYDILEWLMPDWTCSPQKGGALERCDYRRQGRPKIEIDVHRCRYETWQLFKQHHYLSQDLNKASKCYVFTWNKKPIAFIAILPFPGVFDAKTRVISRIVVLPDFQGLGIGKALINYISSLYSSIGSKMYIRTVNPAIGIVLGKDKNWKETCKNLKPMNSSTASKDTNGQQNRLKRVSYSYKYEGIKNTDNTDIITFNADAWKDVSQNQISLF